MLNSSPTTDVQSALIVNFERIIVYKKHLNTHHSNVENGGQISHFLPPPLVKIRGGVDKMSESGFKFGLEPSL